MKSEKCSVGWCGEFQKGKDMQDEYKSKIKELNVRENKND